uniref:nucleotide-binding oligomerization domain-containing protein 2-like isoform X2 n=1 Tax=Myxine glutinosa TaxID=7769 RepID=UPI00358E8139
MSAAEFLRQRREDLIGPASHQTAAILDNLLARGLVCREEAEAVLAVNISSDAVRHLLTLVGLKGEKAARIFLMALHRQKLIELPEDLDPEKLESGWDEVDSNLSSGALTILQRNRPRIVENLDELEELADHLVAEDVITMEDRERITLAGLSRQQKVRNLLDTIYAKGEAAGEVFLKFANITDVVAQGHWQNPVEKFKEKLCKHHEAATRCIRTYSNQEALELDSIFVEPCLQTITSDREEGGPVTLPELLPPSEVAKGRNVVIVSGDAGSGKSTLLLKLIRDWALKTSYGTFDMLFFFRCSDLSLLDCKVSLHELLFDRCCCPDIRRDLVIQRILKRPQSVLLCFDALDEFRQLLGENTPVCASHDCQVSVATLLVNLLQGTLLRETTKVVTTRIPVDLQPLFSSTVARTVVVAGFTPEGVLTYQKHFPQNDDDGRRAALDLLTSSPQIRGLCQLPIYSWIIAKSHSCIRAAELDNSSSCKSTLTTTEVLLSLVQVFLQHNMTTTKARCRVALFDEAKPAIWRLGKLALAGLVNGDSSFREKDLNNCEIEESDLALGFVSKSRSSVGCDIDEIFSFLHTTLQTFLAALFLTTFHSALTLLEHFPNYQRPSFPFKFFLCGRVNAHLQKRSQLGESKKSNLKVLSHFLSGLMSKHHEKLITTMAGSCHSLSKNRKTLVRHLQHSMRLLFRNLAASTGRRPSDMASSTDHLTDDFLWLTSCAYEFGEESVAKQLAIDIPVHYMKLHHMSLPPGTCTHLAYVLLHLPGRVELCLDNNFIGDLGIDQLLPCIDKFTELRLSSNHITDVGARMLVSGILKYDIVTYLGLFKNKLTDAVAEDIAHLVSRSNTLEILKLGGNNFTASGGTIIAKALKHNTQLKMVGLWGNRVGDEGAIAFAEVLKENNTLDRLSLVSNGVGHLGVRHLASMLHKNTGLHFLWLCENNLQDEDAQVLADALENNTGLWNLWLNNNNITLIGANALISALRKNTTLTQLVLRSNAIPTDDYYEILESDRRID